MWMIGLIIKREKHFFYIKIMREIGKRKSMKVGRYDERVYGLAGGLKEMDKVWIESLHDIYHNILSEVFYTELRSNI